MEKSEIERYRQIGKRIRESRVELGLSQLELAEQLRYQSATAISLIEAGIRKVRLSDLEKIAKILRQDFDYLLNGKRPKREPNIQTALRAEELTGGDIERVEEFIRFVKQQRNERHRK